MAHDFQVVDSELLLDAPILAVRRDNVTMPGGGVASREVVEHLGAVAIAAVDERGRVAMVQQYRHSVGCRLWELPAGRLDVKGETPVRAAQRELQEEAGLAASDWGVMADIVNSPGYCEEACRVFLARGLTEVERPEATGDEEADMDFEWVNLDDACRRIFAGEITNSIAVAGIFAAREVLRGAGDGSTPLRDPESDFELRPTSMARRRQGPDLKQQ